MSCLDSPRSPLPKREDIKLIVSDVDGTLLDSHHTLPTSNPTHRVLRRIRDAYPYLPIVVSTGKQYLATASLRAQLDLHPFYACHLNGNVIYNPDGSILSETGLDLPVVLAVYERMRAEGFSLFLYDYDKVYQVLPWKTDVESSLWADKLRGYGEHVVSYSEAEVVMAKVRSGEIKVVKMAVCEAEAALPAARRVLESWTPTDAFALTQALTFCIELIPAAHNKGTALSRLLAHLNTASPTPIYPANVIAFGDGENDVSMFKVAGMSVAMGNAMAVAKAAATWDTVSNDEGGVGTFLERVFFSEEQ